MHVVNQTCYFLCCYLMAITLESSQQVSMIFPTVDLSSKGFSESPNEDGLVP